jgi:hypothetical protein
MKHKNFEIREPVKVITRYLGKFEYFLLPDECLFFGESYTKDNSYVILWHGTTHAVPKEDVYKLDDSITVEDKGE